MIPAYTLPGAGSLVSPSACESPVAQGQALTVESKTFLFQVGLYLYILLTSVPSLQPRELLGTEAAEGTPAAALTTL